MLEVKTIGMRHYAAPAKPSTISLGIMSLTGQEITSQRLMSTRQVQDLASNLKHTSTTLDITVWWYWRMKMLTMIISMGAHISCYRVTIRKTKQLSWIGYQPWKRAFAIGFTATRNLLCGKFKQFIQLGMELLTSQVRKKIKWFSLTS